jgi:hypothetical protein
VYSCSPKLDFAEPLLFEIICREKLLLLLLLSTHIKTFAKEFEEFFKPVFG